MGIQGLNEFVKKEAEKRDIQYKGTGNLADLAGQRIAIDMGSVISVCVYNAKKECVKKVDICQEEPSMKDLIRQSIEMVVYKLSAFLENGINPICCFDGAMDKKKQHAWKKREKSRDASKEKYEDVKKKIKDAGPLDRSEQLIEEYRRRYCSVMEPGLKRDVTRDLRAVLQGFGIICLTPGEKGLDMNGEAETLCAHLVINDFCTYVYSTDSDLYAYGVPYLMTDIRRNYAVKGDRKVVEYTYEYNDTQKIIQILGFKSFDEFQEFCVMCGTDYNSNIFRVGPAKASKHIKTHGSIDKIPLEGKEILDHVYVLSIFRSAYGKSSLTEDDLHISINISSDLDFSHILYESEPTVTYVIVNAIEKFNDKITKKSDLEITSRLAETLIF